MGNRLIYPLVMTFTVCHGKIHQDTSVDPPRWLLRMKGQEAGQKAGKIPEKGKKHGKILENHGKKGVYSWKKMGNSWDMGKSTLKGS